MGNAESGQSGRSIGPSISNPGGYIWNATLQIESFLLLNRKEIVIACMSLASLGVASLTRCIDSMTERVLMALIGLGPHSGAPRQAEQG